MRDFLLRYLVETWKHATLLVQLNLSRTHTCNNDGGEYPALSVTHGVPPLALHVLLQNGHAPVPVPGRGAARIGLAPAALDDAAVAPGAIHECRDGAGHLHRVAAVPGSQSGKCEEVMRL